MCLCVLGATSAGAASLLEKRTWEWKQPQRQVSCTCPPTNPSRLGCMIPPCSRRIRGDGRGLPRSESHQGLPHRDCLQVALQGRPLPSRTRKEPDSASSLRRRYARRSRGIPPAGQAGTEPSSREAERCPQVYRLHRQQAPGGTGRTHLRRPYADSPKPLPGASHSLLQKV